MICGDPIGISLYKEHLRFYLAIRVMIFLSAVLSKKAFQAKNTYENYWCRVITTQADAA